MAEVAYWTINQDDYDTVDLCVRDNQVSVEIPRVLQETVRLDLTPAKAEELARDLRAAAKLARVKAH